MMPEDTIRCQSLYAIGLIYVSTAPDSSLLYSERSKELSEKLHYPKGIAAALNLIGFYYSAKNMQPKALATYLELLKISEQYQLSTYQLRAMERLGYVYMTQKNYSLAEEYMKKGLEIATRVKDTLRMAYLLVGMGNIENSRKNYRQYSEYNQQALTLMEYLHRPDGIAVATGSIGEAYVHLGNVTKGREYLFRALRINQEIQQEQSTCEMFVVIAESYILTKQPNIALKYIDSAKALAESTAALFVPDCWRLYAEAYSQQGQFEKAFLAYKQFKKLSDSLLSQENTRQIADLQSHYEIASRESSIKILTKDKENQQLQIYIMWGGGVGLLALLTLAINGYRLKEKSNKEILQQQRLLEEQAVEITQTNAALSSAYKESEKLLLNILPNPIAHRLKSGEHPIADKFDSVTVLFADIVGFTKLTLQTTPEELVSGLNAIFNRFDALTKKYGVEKIKTIGDAYMVAGGLPERCDDHCERVVRLALEMQAVMSEEALRTSKGDIIRLRIGIHTGEAVAGVIGTLKFKYDLWGDTVNTASRMESHGEPGTIHCSDEVYQCLQDRFAFEPCGFKEIKGKGTMRTWYIKGEIPSSFISAELSLQQPLPDFHPKLPTTLRQENDDMKI